MKSSFLKSILFASAIFSGLTIPLAVFGSNSLNIEVQKEHVFAGTLKDIATPYLGFAGLVSVGAGTVSLAIAKWRRSAHKSTQVEGHLLDLQKELKEKAERIDELSLTEPYLSSVGLQSFLESKQPELSSTAAQMGVQTTAATVQATTVQQDASTTQLPFEKSVPEATDGVTSLSSCLATLKALLVSLQAEQLEAQFNNQSSVQPVPEVVQGIYNQAVQQQVIQQQTMQHATQQQQALYSHPLYNASLANQPANDNAVHNQVVQSQPVHRQPKHQQFAYAQSSNNGQNRDNAYPESNGPRELNLLQTKAFEMPQSRFLAEQGDPLANLSSAMLSQVNELQNQLLQITSHIESLQYAWQSVPNQQPVPAVSEVYTSEIDKIYRQLQLLEIRHQTTS